VLAGLHRRGLLGAAARERLQAMDGATVTELVDEAVEVSAITCSRQGADPPTAQELRERHAG
jgi:fructokinase